MKKSIILGLIALAFIGFTSCKEKKKEDVKAIEKAFTVNADSTAINWTAYKTTEKLPVKGVFQELTIEGPSSGSTVVEALNGVKVNIPVSSLFTKDTIRDGKLKKFFFGVMKNTTLISGTLTLKDASSGSINLTMNGITKELPVAVSIEGNKASFEALINLDLWEAQEAVIALNEACKVLHTGADGVTKTWSEVKLEVTTTLSN